MIQGLKLDIYEWRKSTALFHLDQFDDIPDEASSFVLIQAFVEAGRERSVAERANGFRAAWRKANLRCTGAEVYIDHVIWLNLCEYALRVPRIMSGNYTEDGTGLFVFGAYVM